MEDVIYFAIIALLGGLAHIIIRSKHWSDFKRYSTLKHVFASPIAGYVWGMLHSEYNFPNGVTAFVVGFSAAAFLESVVQRFSKTY